MEKPYLSICAIYKDEAAYLAEWIEFHRLVGVERFFLYDDRSTDNHAEVLAPYVEQGIVTVRAAPLTARPPYPVHPGQMASYTDCIERHRHDSRWIAFIDLDEFLFSPSLTPVSEVITDYEQFPAVTANCMPFGSSNHREKPEGLVIENYIKRTKNERLQVVVKSIVDPTRAVRALTPHEFEYTDGTAVDENRQPVPHSRNDSRPFEKLRVNHYKTKSEAEFRARLDKWRDDSGERRPTRPPEDMHRGAFNRLRDEAILPYVEPLREALVRAAERHSRAERDRAAG
jgi:hypothetical protein